MAEDAVGGGGAALKGAAFDAGGAVSARPTARRHVSSRPLGPDERAVRKEQVCRQCGRLISGQFVRALGGVYHLECFRCADCGCNVASKFFSATDDMMHENPGQLFPLCETDYFRRLDLLCAKCGRALRGSYITALGVKYHVEHFTCSLCATQFGPEDSYYEHGGQVYCHFHYSTLFAIQCAGCQTAILKQFVEINRNNADEHWHPECYMIHRYWKIKLAPQAHAPSSRSHDDGPEEMALSMPGALALSPSTSSEGEDETPASVLQKQRAMEHRVFTIWRVLSAFEESSAACISDMLRHVGSGKYLGGVRFAARFVVHVEVLFSAIDELDMYSQRAGAPSIQYVREARMLCKKIVNFFSLLSHSQETGEERVHITEELLSLVTGLAHYLKILIRISLTGALRLDQEHGVPAALESFLARLDELVSLQGMHDTLDTDVVHGYTSLPCVRGPPEADQAADLCVVCGYTVEDECVRWGTSLRWHWACMQCAHCQRGVLKPDGSVPVPLRRDVDEGARTRPSSVPITQFVYLSARRDKAAVKCVSCAGEAASRYVPVTRLEQYAFLLCVALKRLDALLKRQALLEVPLPPEPEPDALTDAESSTYRKSAEAKRIESQYLDRHMSSKAHVPRISTVIGQPSGFHTAPGGDSVRHVDATPPARPPAGAIPIRAPFARHNSDVLVRVDGAPTPPIPSDATITHDEGITLADIPMILQAEHDREQRVPGEAARRPMSSLSFEELLVLKYVALARLQRSVLGDQLRMDDLLELLEVRKSTFWGKFLFKGGKDRRDVRRKGVFGVSLDFLVERHGADSTLGATPTPMRVPALIDDLVSAMRQMDVSVEGIFRKNGHMRRLKELADALDRDADTVNLLEDHPVQLAALLKKFLRELPDPLFTARLYPLFLATQATELEATERHRLLRLLTLLLPQAHRDTMEVLFVFFKFVATFSYVDDETGSRMDVANLATVLAPSLLFTRAAEPTPGEAQVAQRVVYEMIEHQDDFWFVSEDLESALRDRALVSAAPERAPVDMLRQCAAYA